MNGLLRRIGERIFKAAAYKHASTREKRYQALPRSKFNTPASVPPPPPLFFFNTLAIKETNEITRVVSCILISSEQNIFTAASSTLFDRFRILQFMST